MLSSSVALTIEQHFANIVEIWGPLNLWGPVRP